MTAETFSEAMEIVRAYGGALWDAAGYRGTYYVSPEGYEDDEKYLVIDGAREDLLDDDLDYAPMDKTALLVMKGSGLVVEATGLEASIALEDMQPVRA